MKIKDYIGKSDFINDVILKSGLTGIDPTISTRFLMMYGERWVFKPVVNIEVVELSEIVANEFKDKWQGLANALVGLDVVGYKKILEKIKVLGENEKTLNSTDLIAAFDADVMVDERGNQTTDTGANETDTTREYTEFLTDLKKVFDNVDTMQKNGIINTVCSDIAGFMALSIY